MRVLLDTNVVIDTLQHRAPWYQESDAIFRALANDRFIGCLTAKQISDIHYFARRH